MSDPGSGKSPMAVLFLVVLVDMLGFTIVIPFLTYFIQDLASGQGITDVGSRDLWVGIIIAVYSLAQFLFTPVLGSMSDRVGRRPVLMFGLVSNSIFFVVFGLSNSLEMAIVARFLAGAGNGNIAVARAYIGDISESSMVARRMGMIGAAFGLGFMIGPFIGGILSDPASGIGGPFDTSFWASHEYLLPCLFSSMLSLVSLTLAYYWLEESLPVEKRGMSDGVSPIARLSGTMSSIIGILRLPTVSTLVIVNFLFLMGFSMMHGTFILFTAMSPENGGLGWDEMDNGWIFAFIGLLGVIIQGGLIGPLSDRFGMKRLMLLGTVLCGLGISSLPYVPSEASWLILGSSAGLAIGNGLFSPTQSSLLTFEAQVGGHELGMVMGAQEGYGALARIIGPLLAAYLWSVTVEGSGIWTYHTCFRASGVVFLMALVLQFNLKLNGEPPSRGTTAQEE
ncbi:MAG: MFS transporter [Candidatus Thalassarchaeaceae archaeon]|nr:MFS transporter [Candidatus Thalassarchaeaceae archaeon]